MARWRRQARQGSRIVCGSLRQRRRPESNRCKRLCRPLRNHSATSPRGAPRVTGDGTLALPRAISSAGRAPPRQGGGHWFEPSIAHDRQPANRGVFGRLGPVSYPGVVSLPWACFPGRSRPISAVDSGSILTDAEGDGISGVGSYRGLGLDSVGSRTHFAGGHGGRLLHGFDPVHHGARREDRRRAQLRKREAAPTPLLPRGRCHGTDCRRMCTGSTCTRLLNRQVQVLRRVPPREGGGLLPLRQASSAVPRDRPRAGLAKPSPSGRKHSTVRRTPTPVGKTVAAWLRLVLLALFVAFYRFLRGRVAQRSVAMRHLSSGAGWLSLPAPRPPPPPEPALRDDLRTREQRDAPAALAAPDPRAARPAAGVELPPASSAPVPEPLEGEELHDSLEHRASCRPSFVATVLLVGGGRDVAMSDAIRTAVCGLSPRCSAMARAVQLWTLQGASPAPCGLPRAGTFRVDARAASGSCVRKEATA